MLTGKAREEMKNILKLSADKDLKIVELRIVPGNSQTKSAAEIIEAILTCASQPSDVLRQQRLRKSVMLRYLWQCRVPVLQGQSKSDYIRILLNMWQVTDDEYLWRFLTEEEIDAAINRFEEKMTTSLQQLKLRIKERRPSPMELQHMKKSMDKFLQKIDSIRNPASALSFQGADPSSVPSDEDSDSSSSSESSVEIIDVRPVTETVPEETTSRAQSPESPPQQEHSNKPSTSQQPSSVNIVESSISSQASSIQIFDPSSSINSSEPSPSQLPSSSDNEPSSSEQVSMDVHESVSPGSPISVHSSQSSSPSKRVAQSRSRRSKHVAGTSPSKKHLVGKVSKASTTFPSIPDGRGLAQTELFRFFGIDTPFEQKYSA